MATGAARDPRTSRDEAAINAIIAAIDTAHVEKNAAAVTAHYALNAVLFDLAPPLGHSFDSHALAAWFETWDGPVRREHREVQIEVSGDLAIRRALVRVSATTRSGQEAAWWMRSTICFRRDGRTWKIVHEHESVPFHMDGSFRAAVDLEP